MENGSLRNTGRQTTSVRPRRTCGSRSIRRGMLPHARRRWPHRQNACATPSRKAAPEVISARSLSKSRRVGQDERHSQDESIRDPPPFSKSTESSKSCLLFRIGKRQLTRTAWRSDPHRPIKAPVLDRFADVLGRDPIRVRQIGDGACHFQNAIVGPRAQAQVSHGDSDQLLSFSR